MPTGDNYGRKCHNLDECSLCTFTARPLVETMFRRGMTTCFAYGQTGSGKTFVNYFDQTIEDIDLDVLEWLYFLFFPKNFNECYFLKFH